MGNAPKDASSPPEKAGEDEDILKLLNSAAWEKRLEAARLQREKILAERAKSGAPRRPTLFPKSALPDRMPVLENGTAKAPKTAANRPAPATRPAAVPTPLPAMPQTASRVATATIATAQAKSTAARAPSDTFDEALAPATPPLAARRPITPVRVALGFGLGLVLGVGATSASWLIRPGPAAVSEVSVAVTSGPAITEPPTAAAVVADEPATVAPATDLATAPSKDIDTTPTDAASLTADPDPFPDPPDATTAVAALSDPDPMVATAMGSSVAPEIETPQVDALQTPLTGEYGMPVSEPTPFQPDVPAILPKAGPQPGMEEVQADPVDPGDVPHSEPSPGDAPTATEPAADVPVAAIDPAPAPPELPAASDATIPVAAPTYPPHQVIVYAPESTADSKVEMETESLASAGFNLDQPRRVDLTIRKDQVRFYHDQDKAVADAVALKLGAEARDFTKSDNRPATGTIEVWLAGDAPAATAAVSSKPPAAKKKKKQPVARGPTESQQLQMLRDRIVSQLQKGEYN